MNSFQSSTWSDIEALRLYIQQHPCDCVEDAAQGFASQLAACCPAVVLARVFVVLPFAKLPPDERRFASDLVGNDARLGETTPVLSLLGTAGRKAEWCDRKRSAGHLAIPLLDAAFVQGIPMIARLLEDFDVTLPRTDASRVLDTRRLLGGNNGAFYVADARTTADSSGRRIIPNSEFVEAYGIRSVFGMGGAYIDGTLAAAVVFTSETIVRLIVDRFPSLIANFKMSTSDALLTGRIFRDQERRSIG